MFYLSRARQYNNYSHNETGSRGKEKKLPSTECGFWGRLWCPFVSREEAACPNQSLRTWEKKKKKQQQQIGHIQIKTKSSDCCWEIRCDMCYLLLWFIFLIKANLHKRMKKHGVVKASDCTLKNDKHNQLLNVHWNQAEHKGKLWF